MMDARALTAALGGKWSGGSGIARCPAHDDRSPSLSITDGATGRPVLHCFAGCSYQAVRDALRQRGLWDERGSVARLNPARAARSKQEELDRNRQRSRQALNLWEETQPISGTLAERYLRGRGITCALPPSLGYVRDCWHLTAKRLPALIAYVTGSDLPAIHRTYLSTDGSGKADLDTPKMMLGPTAGGAVRLSNAPGPLVVTEGIETGLSLLSGLLRRPANVWAALSAPGMERLRLPSQPGRLTIAPDGDPVGRRAAEALATRAHGLGWTVSFLEPPEGLDWNDVLTGKAVTA